MSTSVGQVEREASAKRQAGSDRDARGRFTAGNKGGPGNPFARKVAELRKALVNFVTEDDMKHVAFILKEKAMGGDLAAIKLLFQYVLGKPTEAVDPDRLDVDEWEKVQEQARPPEEAAEVLERMPAEMACRFTNRVWPGAVENNLSTALQEEMQVHKARDAERDADVQSQAGAPRPAARVKRRPKGNGGNGRRARDAGGAMANGTHGEAMARLRQLVSQALAGRHKSGPGVGVGESPSPNGGSGGGEG